jgi:ribonuclease HII
MSSAPRKLQGVAGIDEAGRGPMIGPMVVCGLLFNEDPTQTLRQLGIKDSKMLTPRKRESLYDEVLRLATKSSVREVSASKIDILRGRGVSLNEIELREFISITKALGPERVIVDAADVNAERFGVAIAERTRLRNLGLSVVSEHRADLTYPVVSAASVIAKVRRDRAIVQLHEEYGDFGSGYPADPRTVSFVKKIVRMREPLPPIVRRSWESVKRIESEFSHNQTTLDSH